MRTLPWVAVIIVGCCLCASPTALFAAEAKSSGPDRQLYQTTVDRAIRFLATGQAQDGSVSSHVGIGPTALATLGL